MLIFSLNNIISLILDIKMAYKKGFQFFVGFASIGQNV